VKKITKTGEQVAIELMKFEDDILKDDDLIDEKEPSEVQFQPTRRQKQARALLSIRAKEQGIALQAVTASTAVELTGIELFNQWFTNEFFIEWVRREGDYAKRVAYLLARHLDNLEEIIEDCTGDLDLRAKLAAGDQLLKIRKSLADDESADTQVDKASLAKRIASVMLEKKKLEAAKTDSTPKPKDLQLPKGNIDVD